jgi:hypothetical protein
MHVMDGVDAVQALFVSAGPKRVCFGRNKDLR